DRNRSEKKRQQRLHAPREHKTRIGRCCPDVTSLPTGRRFHAIASSYHSNIEKVLGTAQFLEDANGWRGITLSGRVSSRPCSAGRSRPCRTAMTGSTKSNTMDTAPWP